MVGQVSVGSGIGEQLDDRENTTQQTISNKPATASIRTVAFSKLHTCRELKLNQKKKRKTVRNTGNGTQHEENKKKYKLNISTELNISILFSE